MINVGDIVSLVPGGHKGRVIEIFEDAQYPYLVKLFKPIKVGKNDLTKVKSSAENLTKVNVYAY